MISSVIVFSLILTFSFQLKVDNIQNKTSTSKSNFEKLSENFQVVQYDELIMPPTGGNNFELYK